MAVYDEATDKIIDYKQLINHSDKQTREWWQQLSADGFGKLLKRVGKNEDGTQRVTRSDTINFIQRIHVPVGEKITYVHFCCDVRLQKDDINQNILIVGGDRLKYDAIHKTK